MRMRPYFGQIRTTLFGQKQHFSYITGGLYGRLTRQILGGIPYYINAFTKGKSLSWNVDHLIFGRDAAFSDEFDRMFDSLFVNSAEYKRMIRFISKSKSGLTREEIASGIVTSGGYLT